MDQRIIIYILIALIIVVPTLIYILRGRTPNKKHIKLQNIQEHTNTLTPYTPKWPKYTRATYVQNPSLSPLTFPNLTDAQILQMRKYLGYLYTAWPESEINSKTPEYLYNFFNSLSLYYNPDGNAAPVFGFTQGWLSAPKKPIIPGGDDGFAGACTNECNPWCEPGFCSKVERMPMIPTGYFAEFFHWFYEFSRDDDIMSIGQTVPSKTQPKGLGHRGQWAVKYVDEDPKTMVQDEVVKKRSIRNTDISLATSMDMWNSFLGRGVTFLQGNTLHRAWWYPNGPPGQIRNPLNKDQIFVPVDAYAMDAPGLDYGMISSKTGKIISLNDCLKDISNFMEYLDMRGNIPNISWIPPHPDIQKRFNVNGWFWTGYLETKATNSNSNIDSYYIEHSRTDFGTNFAFTGNWIDIFEGAGIFYKYSKTLIAPNKCGAVFKLMAIITNNKNTPNDKDKNYGSRYELLRRIIGVDYVNSSNPKDHSPQVYSDGNTYSNELGVTQGMCMGVSLPGKKGTVVLDPTDPDSGAQLWKEAYEIDKSDYSMIFLGMMWLLCNSVAHPPENNTSYVSETNPSYGYSSNTWTFFTQWATAKNLDVTKPADLLLASKQFLMICAMGSGGSPPENYMLNQWQNTTIYDYLMFTLGSALDYDLIQLTMDITENNLWTRESLAMYVPPDLNDMLKIQLYANGPHGGSFLVFSEQFGTGYTTKYPIFKNKKYDSNPMPFYRNPDVNKANWIDNLGPAGSPNKGEVITYDNDLFKTHSKFVSSSDFNTKLFSYYANNGILTIRNPTDLLSEPDANNAQIIKDQMTFFLKQTFDRKVDPSKVTYDKQNRAHVTWDGFDSSVPLKRISQRGFGDWFAFFAKDTQTQDWSRQAAGFAF
jgi:hypothetical protein